MRRWAVIVRATALEILSEPLSLLLLLMALALATLAPAFHYHQFGEATRMARDAGLSSLFTVGVILTVFGAVRSIRREIETGTAQMALAHPISRTTFFLAKVLGVWLAFGVFALILALTLLTIVKGAAVGGVIAARTGDIARLWGPSLALGVGTAIVPLVLAALLNRFARCRFVLTFFRTAAVVSVVGALCIFDVRLAVRLLPVAVVAAIPSVVFGTLAAAAAVRFRVNGAVTVVGLFLAAALPVLGNYYLSNALAGGGSLPASYVVGAILSALPVVIAALVAGVGLFNGKDVG